MAEARADIIALSDYAYQRVKVPPFTTIAWRLWHLIGCYAEARNAAWLGWPPSAGSVTAGDPAPATAAEAVTALEHAASFWKNLLEGLPAEAWSEKLGPVAGPFADDSRTSLVLHQIDEQIHHGAELGVLRDLYRSQP